LNAGAARQVSPGLSLGSGERLGNVELLIARNPDPEAGLPYLLWLPLAGGMVLRTSGTWPRTKALYCYPVPVDEWPDAPDEAGPAVRRLRRHLGRTARRLGRARKSLQYLVASLTGGKLRYALAELAALPRVAVVAAPAPPTPRRSDPPC